MVCTEISCCSAKQKETVAGHSELFCKLISMHVFYASDKFLSEHVIAVFSNFESSFLQFEMNILCIQIIEIIKTLSLWKKEYFFTSNTSVSNAKRFWLYEKHGP